MDFIPSQKYELLQQNADMTTKPLKAPHGRKRRPTTGGFEAFIKVNATTWLTRIVPILIAAMVGFGLYAAVYHNCIQYIIRQRHHTGSAIALLVLLFLSLGLTIVCYLRTLYVVKTNPALVPLSNSTSIADAQTTSSNLEPKPPVSANRNENQNVDMEANESNFDYAPPLDWFYTTNVFLCESDGLPRWCSECRQRKPDRAHHSSELGRCVYKMDHYCPWVGGVVSETSFKFFTQFNAYCFMFCAVVLACNAYGIALRKQLGHGVDAMSIACSVISGFFAFFCFLMACTSIRYILANETNIDMMKRRMSQYVAILVPLDSLPNNRYRTKTYPLDVTLDFYPLAPQPPRASCYQRRTFAVLRLEPGENPWDLGWKRNWTQVMGEGIFQWLFPLDMSPCSRHDDGKSEYPAGPLIDVLKKRYNVLDCQRSGSTFGSPT